MTYQLLHLFSNLTVAAAGLMMGLSLFIVVYYWRLFRHMKRSYARLLPLHIILIGTSNSMIALIAVLRLGDPPPPSEHHFSEWWIYPFITLAFMIGDLALIMILKFIAQRGPRYREKNERRS